MPARKRVAASGSERAEFENIYGPLETDPVDPRFVLVDEETEQKLRELRPGVPPRQSQVWDDVVQIKEAYHDAQGTPLVTDSFEGDAKDEDTDESASDESDESDK